MSTPSWRRTITLRDGARVTLRPIAPEDKPLLAPMTVARLLARISPYEVRAFVALLVGAVANDRSLPLTATDAECGEAAP